MVAIAEILARLEAGVIDLPEAFALACPDSDPRERPVPRAGGDLVVARLDRNRGARCGFPEFIYGAGKTVEELLSIIPQLRKDGANVLATRLAEDAGRKLAAAFPEGSYDPRGRSFLWKAPRHENRGRVMILAAGTSDLPVALEAQATLEACDCASELIVDVGVAALHRLLKVLDRLRGADAIIAAAGMEGALPSVVAGLVKAPVIAVPTSIGYGAGLNGITPMLAMLNSCASGVTVVNIDNGFGAACAAARIINAKH